MDDATVLSRINDLVDEEHRLREQMRNGQIDGDEEQARLRELEVALDQCWDLLRRRRAARDRGADPDAERPHDIVEVEGYLQ